MTGAIRPRIRTLNIRCVRGIVDLELKLNGKGLVLQGANGEGKSSIADALELALTGEISHLAGKQSLSLAKHGKHIRASEPDVQVNIALNDGGELSRGLSGEPSLKGSAGEYRNDARRGTFLLRRAQLLSFIHADPAERFRELAALIGIVKLDALELAFKRATDAVKGTLDAEVSFGKARDTELATLTGLPATKLSNDQILAFANRLLLMLQRPEAADLAAAEAAAMGFLDPVAIGEKTRALVALEAAQSSVNELAVQAEALGLLDAFVEKVNAFRSREEARRIDVLASLLEAGDEYLRRYEPSACPLCEQPVDALELQGRLGNRRELLSELSSEATRLRTEAAALAARLTALFTNLTAFLLKHGSLSNAETGGRIASVAAGVAATAGLLRQQSLLSAGALPEHQPEAYAALIRELSALAFSYTERIEAAKPTDTEQATVVAMQSILRVQTLLRDREAGSARIRLHTRLSERAKIAQTELIAAKNEVVLDIYAAIKSDVDGYYGMLHPGEAHGNIVLDVAKRASTTLLMDSYGIQQQDPRGFSSEGHLDSLGLCIFLAFANTFRGLCCLLVLDDVVMSIDSGHRQRIADLLVKQFDDFQLIVTTHDRIWFQEIVDTQKANGREGDFLAEKIVGWTIEAGPTLSSYMPAHDRVLEKLAKGDLSGAGADTRRNLEWALQQIAERIQATVPYMRDPRYTAEMLYQPVKHRLTKLCPSLTSHAIKDLEATKLFGNMTVHATADTESVSKEEIEAYAEAVAALQRSFSCSGCDALLEYDQKAKLVLCRNAKCQKKTVHNCN